MEDGVILCCWVSGIVDVVLYMWVLIDDFFDIVWIEVGGLKLDI